MGGVNVWVEGGTRTPVKQGKMNIVLFRVL